jgi:hypothetical protein
MLFRLKTPMPLTIMFPDAAVPREVPPVGCRSRQKSARRGRGSSTSGVREDRSSRGMVKLRKRWLLWLKGRRRRCRGPRQAESHNGSRIHQAIGGAAGLNTSQAPNYFR